MVELCNFKKIVLELEVYGELHYNSDHNYIDVDKMIVTVIIITYS